MNLRALPSADQVDQVGRLTRDDQVNRIALPHLECGERVEGIDPRGRLCAHVRDFGTRIADSRLRPAVSHDHGLCQQEPREEYGKASENALNPPLPSGSPA